MFGRICRRRGRRWPATSLGVVWLKRYATVELAPGMPAGVPGRRDGAGGNGGQCIGMAGINVSKGQTLCAGAANSIDSRKRARKRRADGKVSAVLRRSTLDKTGGVTDPSDVCYTFKDGKYCGEHSIQ